MLSVDVNARKDVPLLKLGELRTYISSTVRPQSREFLKPTAAVVYEWRLVIARSYLL